ncbi:MAG: hypothetical protein ACOC32_03990 [Nanoarchaeota archaeon]
MMKKTLCLLGLLVALNASPGNSSDLELQIDEAKEENQMQENTVLSDNRWLKTTYLGITLDFTQATMLSTEYKISILELSAKSDIFTGRSKAKMRLTYNLDFYVDVRHNFMDDERSGAFAGFRYRF